MLEICFDANFLCTSPPCAKQVDALARALHTKAMTRRADTSRSKSNIGAVVIAGLIEQRLFIKESTSKKNFALNLKLC